MPRAYRKTGCSGVICTGKLSCNICNSNILGSWIYVLIIGFIGTIVTAYDVIRLINCKPGEKDGGGSHPQDENSPETPGDNSPITMVPQEVERDLKLMTSVLGIEHYTLIMLGVLTDYPMLHAPWLLMQLCIIIIEIIVFFIRLFIDGLHVNRDEILLALLTIYNWLQVFCVYQQQLNQVCF